MVDSTHIRIDKETLGKLKAMANAGGKSLPAFLRDVANGNHTPGTLTLDDIAIQIGASQSAIIKRLGELEAIIQAKKHDVNKS